MVKTGECRQTPEGQVLASLLAGRLSPFKGEIIFANKNADINGLINYIKQLNFDTTVFSQPIVSQADKFTEQLVDAFSLFVPTKTVFINNYDQPWCNAYTRLLQRKENRNYQIFKKLYCDYFLNQFFCNHDPGIPKCERRVATSEKQVRRI